MVFHLAMPGVAFEVLEPDEVADGALGASRALLAAAVRR